ncbi:15909_t:CDS:2 [Dentiscutata heterogama]|uniref:15909_t:CDS:1 n=1 Tax=Dentiscutata heterogama TaxID=1316150 RepID=A0ACA9K9A8_9GLOM|nr:15909_t:CDS:2 [Dentiscutata heterogama]
MAKLNIVHLGILLILCSVLFTETLLAQGFLDVCRNDLLELRSYQKPIRRYPPICLPREYDSLEEPEAQNRRSTKTFSPPEKRSELLDDIVCELWERPDKILSQYLECPPPQCHECIQPPPCEECILIPPCEEPPPCEEYILIPPCEEHPHPPPCEECIPIPPCEEHPHPLPCEEHSYPPPCNEYPPPCNEHPHPLPYEECPHPPPCEECQCNEYPQPCKSYVLPCDCDHKNPPRPCEPSPCTSCPPPCNGVQFPEQMTAEADMSFRHASIVVKKFPDLPLSSNNLSESFYHTNSDDDSNFNMDLAKEIGASTMRAVYAIGLALLQIHPLLYIVNWSEPVCSIIAGGFFFSSIASISFVGISSLMSWLIVCKKVQFDLGAYDYKLFIIPFGLSAFLTAISASTFGSDQFWCYTPDEFIIVPICLITVDLTILVISLFCYLSILRKITNFDFKEQFSSASRKIVSYILVYIVQWVPLIAYLILDMTENSLKTQISENLGQIWQAKPGHPIWDPNCNQ